MLFRVGSGHDSHRFKDGRPLILGGVRIDHDRGLDGHSDADVVLHALTDAILGALAQGDIGELFPDTDARNKDADSTIFLKEAMKRLSESGYALGNIDVTLFAQEPKLGPAKAIIRDHLARLVGLPVDAVNVKAKTGEKVGHIGRAEAVACHVAILIHKPDEGTA